MELWNAVHVCGSRERFAAKLSPHVKNYRVADCGTRTFGSHMREMLFSARELCGGFQSAENVSILVLRVPRLCHAPRSSRGSVADGNIGFNDTRRSSRAGCDDKARSSREIVKDAFSISAASRFPIKSPIKSSEGIRRVRRILKPSFSPGDATGRDDNREASRAEGRFPMLVLSLLCNYRTWKSAGTSLPRVTTFCLPLVVSKPSWVLHHPGWLIAAGLSLSSSVFSFRLFPPRLLRSRLIRSHEGAVKLHYYTCLLVAQILIYLIPKRGAKVHAQDILKGSA